MIAAALRQFIREHRRSRTFALAASACEKYLRAYHNEDFFVFAKNGEQFALRKAAGYLEDTSPVIWDVGAHLGEWALAARQIFPAATIHSFEVMPQIAERLTHLVARDSAITVHALGMSDQPGDRTVHLNEAHDSTNSIAPRVESPLFQAGTSEFICQCTTCDQMALTIPPPTILKIDVEGHEVAVLRGAKAMLASTRRPLMIQIEYGDTYLPARSTLRDVYQLLEVGNYQIGRLFPNHVHFKPYEHTDEHFRMGNLIAVYDERLKATLA